jgi:hypothetical protein
MRAKPLAAGRHAVAWDGLDHTGTPVEGDVQWRMATSQGLESQYLLSIGTSMREHHWPAQHIALCGVAVDAQRIYVTSGLSEGMPQTAAMTREGGWQWVSGPTGWWVGGYDLALDGDTLYFLGGPVAGDTSARKTSLFVQQAGTGKGKPGLENTHSWGPYPNWPVAALDEPRRVDARDGDLVLASPSTGLVVWLNPSNGKEIDRLQIEGGLVDIASLGGGRVLAIAGTAVVEAARGRAERAVRISDLTSPHRLTVDRVTGDVFIAEAGASQQIKQFDSAGKLLKTFGRAGGRKRGRYEAEDFRDVSDLSGDGEGGFVVTEASAPRRTAHVSPVGTVVREWYGGQAFFTYVDPEPDDADRLWMHSDGELTRLSADYDRGTWQPLATYGFADALDPDVFPTGIGMAAFRVKRLNLTGSGNVKTYVYPKWNLPLVLEADEAAGLLRPVAAMGAVPGKFTAQVDSYRQAPIPVAQNGNAWSLSATGNWKIHHAGQEAWLEVLDAAGKPIVSLSMFRGEPRPNVTSNSGHENYLVFNGGEVMNSASPDWSLAKVPQEFQITVANGVATLLFGGKVTLERPVLAGDWRRPSRLQSRATKGGDIDATKAGFAEGTGERRRPIAVAIEKAEVTSPPLEPAVFAEAIRRLGKDPEDPAVRSQLAYFAWADANGDYAIQADELRLSPQGGGSVLFIDDALNVYLRSDAASGPDYTVVTPLGRTPTGSPIWDWSRQRAGPNTPFSQTRSLWVDSEGNVYQTSAHGGDGYNHHWEWPATYVNATAVAKTSPDGTMLWQAGERAPRPLPHPRGQMHHPINTLGTVHGCIGFADYIENPAEFWTEDGLYIGGVFDRHAPEPHPRAYGWRRPTFGDDFVDNLALLQHDLLLGGNLATRRNGDVLFFGCGYNNMPVYRVTGWDTIERQQGTVTRPASPRPAARKGTGLKAEYCADGTREAAAATRVDERLWLDATHAWPQDPESVRWTGFIEPPLSGAYTFSFYTVDGRARLWIGGRKLLDHWNVPGKYWAEPVELEAGRRYPVRIEWRRRGDKPEFHLNWEALDLPVEHVPTTALYPNLADGEEPAMLPVPPAAPGAYEEVLDPGGEPETIDLRLPTPQTEGWSLAGIARFSVANANDTATFEILDADAKPLVEWTVYRGEPRPGVTRDRGHTNYMIFNGKEIAVDPSGHIGVEVPFTLHCAEGNVRLDLPDRIVVERPIATGDHTRPTTLRATAHPAQGGGRVRVEKIVVTELSGEIDLPASR